jgi:hypothetical protein
MARARSGRAAIAPTAAQAIAEVKLRLDQDAGDVIAWIFQDFPIVVNVGTGIKSPKRECDVNAAKAHRSR